MLKHWPGKLRRNAAIFHLCCFVFNQLILSWYVYSVTFRERRAYPCCPVDVALAEIALEAINDLRPWIDCHKTSVAYVHPKMRTSGQIEQMDLNIVDSMNPARNAKVNGGQSGGVARCGDPMESREFVDACCVTGGGAFRDFRRWRKYCRPWFCALRKTRWWPEVESNHRHRDFQSL